MGSLPKCTLCLLSTLVGISCHYAHREATCPAPVQARGFNLLAKASFTLSVHAKFPDGAVPHSVGQTELETEFVEHTQQNISLGTQDPGRSNATVASLHGFEVGRLPLKKNHSQRDVQDNHSNTSSYGQLGDAGEDSTNRSPLLVEDARELSFGKFSQRGRHGKGRVQRSKRDDDEDAEEEDQIKGETGDANGTQDLDKTQAGRFPWKAAKRKNPRKKSADETDTQPGGGTLTAELICCLFWFAMCVGALVLFWWDHREVKETLVTAPEDDGEESLETPGPGGPEAGLDKDAVANFDEDIYGLTVGMLIKDAHAACIGNVAMGSLRWSRIMSNVFLLYFTMALQIFIMMQVQRFVVPGAIGSVRLAYSEFEWEMHGKDPDNGELVASNLFLGDPEFFNASHFADLDESVKKDVCHIPFSQPVFCVACLFMWTLTCTGELRKALEEFEMFVWIAPTVSHLTHGVRDRYEVSETRDAGLYGKPRVVHSLTMRMKVLISVFILLPRAMIAGRLIWMGCRWLSATNDFGDLIMNAMALEFILLLKDLLYLTLVANRTKRDLQNIEIQIYSAKERPSYSSFFTSLLWGVVALVWSTLYTLKLQQVLPGYNWDVRQVCTSWLRVGDQ